MRYAIPLLKNIGRRALGAVSKGATQYLSGSKSLAPAMIDSFGEEAMDVVKSGYDHFQRRQQRGKGVKKKVINKIYKDSIFN